MFSQFFLQTLYMQQVLRYSAIQTGLAFMTMTVAIVIFSNVAQLLVGRLGVRRVLTTGLLLTTAALALLTRLPTDGRYVSDLLPAFVLAGLGMALTFVPMTIAGLTGVTGSDAGVASGLINTSRQIGGAVGLAAVSSIAAAYAGHGTLTAAANAADLTRGFQVGFDVLTGLTLLAAVVTFVFIAPISRPVQAAARDTESTQLLEEAA
jgi:fucose permease